MSGVRRTRRQGGALVALVALLVLAWGLWELSQKPGTAGCVSETGTTGACQNGKALVFPRAVTGSPAGKSVYAVWPVSDAVAVFDRDPATGALAQRPGTAGCVSDDLTFMACQDAAALDAAYAIAASPDGTSVYAVSIHFDAIAGFDRDPATGR
jgi:DNA-binding beta-propeller fold protein YncE